MTPRNAICIVVDGLRASALGTYGNTWYGTPSLDRLASQSLVAEWMMIDRPELDAFYRGVWEGVHALRPARPDLLPAGLPEPSQSLPLRLAWAGVQQTLVTDELWLDGHADRMSLEQPFPEQPWWDTHWLDTETNRPSPTIADTSLGKVFAAAIEQIETWPEGPSRVGNLLWLHARGMRGPWDAPEGLRQELAEVGEISLPESVTPPRRESGDDPDRWLGLRIAYAAQVVVLDACLGALLAALDEMEEPPLVTLVGSRGFALGEHAEAGTACRDLHGELLHVPWLLRVPGQRDGSSQGPPQRFSGLTQPSDLAATMIDWFALEAGGDGRSLLTAYRECPSDWRQMVVAHDAGGQRVVRTPAWMFRHKAGESGCAGTPQLFAKPDDRWEVNDVASRCPDIVEAMLALLAEHERRLTASSALDLLDLAPELLNPQR